MCGTHTDFASGQPKCAEVRQLYRSCCKMRRIKSLVRRRLWKRELSDIKSWPPKKTENRNSCDCKTWEIIRVLRLRARQTNNNHLSHRREAFTWYPVWVKSVNFHELNSDFKTEKRKATAPHHILVEALSLDLCAHFLIVALLLNMHQIYISWVLVFLFLLFSRLFDINPIFSDLGRFQCLKGFWLISSKYTQTDRQTDGRTDGQTESSSGHWRLVQKPRVCCSGCAVRKTPAKSDHNHHPGSTLRPETIPQR